MAFSWVENHQDNVIQVEDITGRVEELCNLRDQAVADFADYRAAKGGSLDVGEGEAKWAQDNPALARELGILTEFLGELCGNGGDYQWESAWYPQFLIQNTHFSTYSKELAEELYDKELRAAKWPFNCIDWEQAANVLEQDYSCVNLPVPDDSGQVITFLYR